MKTLPKPQLILDYKLVFGVEPPTDRLSIIKDISRDSILYEITALNYRLKPKDKIYIDNSFDTQVRELKYFTQTEELFIKYSNVAEKFTKSENDFPTIFTRQTCLFATEEIINSEQIKNIEGFVMARLEVWEAILRYLLAVNYAVTQIREETDEKKINFESLNPKLLPLNELNIETDIIFTPYRGYELIAYFLKNEKLAPEIIEYFKDKYGIEPQHFIFHIMRMYLVNSGSKDPSLNFFYSITDETKELFAPLSIRTPNPEIYKLLNIRKSPFINVGPKKYLISDNSFLLEKTYSQFLNDLWFDRIKTALDHSGKPKFTIKDYRSEFGYFFEGYLTELAHHCFDSYKYSKLLLFDELKIQSSKGVIEIADFYLRYNKRILLGQVKSGSIYDNEKYGGTTESLYKKNRNEFFKNFGVSQLIESIRNLDNHGLTVDKKFPKGHTYHVYPCIVVNDKAFQTPLMADTFNKRFQELIPSLKLKKVIVKKLTLIHIGDLERLEDFLKEDAKQIWNLLDFNCRHKFIPPFYNTINRILNGRKYPKRVMGLFEELILKYNPNNTDEKNGA
jgi:hypothetical protein